MRSVYTNSEVLAQKGIDGKLTSGLGCARFLLLRRPNLNQATRMYRKTATALVLATLAACNSADIASTDPSQNRPEPAKLDIVIGGQDQMPSWSPDGKKIVFVSERSGAPNLWIMNADGSGPRQLTAGGSFDYYPRWR
jgi:hypothetical protein